MGWRPAQRRPGLEDARLGPAVSDVAYCSVDLSMTRGSRAADSFVAHYRRLSGDPLDDVHRWHLLWIADAMGWAEHWRAGYLELGLTDLTMATIRRRLRTAADRALATVGAVEPG